MYFYNYNVLFITDNLTSLFFIGADEERSVGISGFFVGLMSLYLCFGEGRIVHCGVELAVERCGVYGAELFLSVTVWELGKLVHVRGLGRLKIRTPLRVHCLVRWRPRHLRSGRGRTFHACALIAFRLRTQVLQLPHMRVSVLPGFQDASTVDIFDDVTLGSSASSGSADSVKEITYV